MKSKPIMLLLALIPKTGDASPAVNYALAGVMFILAGVSGFALLKERATRQRRV